MESKYRIDDYVKVARSTAIYPETAKFTYPVLGLAGEYGEVVDEVFLDAKIKPAKRALIAELGDVLWYVFNTMLDLDLQVHDIADIVTGGLRCETFEDICFQRLKPRDGRSPWLKMTVHIGQLAEVAKKGLRDGYGPNLDEVKRSVCANALAQILVSLCEICDKQHLSLGEIAASNNRKLTSRKNRDKLKGDGNDR